MPSLESITPVCRPNLSIVGIGNWHKNSEWTTITQTHHA